MWLLVEQKQVFVWSQDIKKQTAVKRDEPEVQVGFTEP